MASLQAVQTQMSTAEKIANLVDRLEHTEAYIKALDCKVENIPQRTLAGHKQLLPRGKYPYRLWERLLAVKALFDLPIISVLNYCDCDFQ